MRFTRSIHTIAAIISIIKNVLVIAKSFYGLLSIFCVVVITISFRSHIFPPIENAGDNQSVEMRVALLTPSTLDGSKSHDPESLMNYNAPQAGQAGRFLYFWEFKPCLGNEELNHIDRAIEAKNTQHFEQEIRNLYPQLIKCGLKVPLIDPVRIGRPAYDNTWHGFHLTSLKLLRREIRNNKFNVEQWNIGIYRKNAKRRNFAKYLIRHGRYGR